MPPKIGIGKVFFNMIFTFYNNNINEKALVATTLDSETGEASKSINTALQELRLTRGRYRWYTNWKEKGKKSKSLCVQYDYLETQVNQPINYYNKGAEIIIKIQKSLAFIHSQ